MSEQEVREPAGRGGVSTEEKGEAAGVKREGLPRLYSEMDPSEPAREEELEGREDGMPDPESPRTEEPGSGGGSRGGPGNDRG